MIFDPAEVDLVEEKDLDSQTLRLMEAYDDGIRTGYTWPDRWDGHGHPGGPSVFRSDPISLEANRLWNKGWDAGHGLKLKFGLSWTVDDHIMFCP